MSHPIAYPYSKALFSLACEEDVLYPVYVSLQEINKLLKEKEEVKILVLNPLLLIDEREQIIKHVFENKIPKLLYKFLMLLNQKNRLYILGSVFEIFDELFLEKNNQMRCSLEVSLPLPEDQNQNLRQKLNRKYHKEFFLDVAIKPELLGGFRLQVAGMLFDSSIKSQLEQFRQKVSI